MLEQVVKPLSSGSILPWLTASRIVTTNSLSQLATPSSISSDQSLTLSGTATATVAGLITAQSGLTVSSNAAVSGTGTVTGLLTASSALTVASTVTLSLQTASRILTTSSTSTVASPSAISTAQTLTLSTATGTTLTVSSTGASAIACSGGATFAGNSSDPVVVLAGANARAQSTYFISNSAAGQNRALGFQTGGSYRWLLVCNNVAESGANAGSNFAWNAYDDTGSFIDSPLTIARMSGGSITVTRPLTLSAAASALTISITTGTSLVVNSTAAVAISCAGGIRVGSTTLLTSSVALTNGAGASAGTLSNAPSAGNPTKWVPINDNGTTRYIPAW